MSKKLGFALLLAVALAVRLSSPGPILFKQRRVGYQGREFTLYKFRSMVVDAERRLAELRALNESDGPLFKMKHDPRVTSVGRFIRAWSIDELPQLFNVLKGEMSLIGPRPERPEFVDVFSETVDRYDDRHRVKAGITGWAQVNGLRGKTSLTDRVEWDNYYIENWSLWLDLKILLLTLPAVIAHFRRA